MSTKRDYEGLRSGYLSQLPAFKKGRLNEQFLINRVWWWRSLAKPMKGPLAKLEEEFRLLFGTHYRRSACNYEFGARFLGKYEFDDTWFNLSDAQKALLRKRWPDQSIDSVCTITTIPDHGVFAKPGWSKPERLSFNLALPNDTVAKDLKIKLDRWRTEMRIEKPKKFGNKKRFFDIIEYMDRRYLLGEPRESDKESAVAQKRHEFMRDVIKCAEDGLVTGALKKFATEIKRPSEVALTPALREALRLWVATTTWASSSPMMETPTDADLARQGLAVLAEDPVRFEAICHFLTDNRPARTPRVPPASVVAASLRIIQGYGQFEHGYQNKLNFVSSTPKPPPRNSPALMLARTLINHGIEQAEKPMKSTPRPATRRQPCREV